MTHTAIAVVSLLLGLSLLVLSVALACRIMSKCGNGRHVVFIGRWGMFIVFGIKSDKVVGTISEAVSKIKKQSKPN